VKMDRKPSKASMIKYLLVDGAYRPSEIADIVQCRREYVSRVGARMRAPVSRYARMDAQLQTLWHEVARLRKLVEGNCTIDRPIGNSGPVSGPPWKP
jgi:hypothetical protein